LEKKHRPVGVTIIAILTIIGGLVFVGSGITAATFVPFLLSHVSVSKINTTSSGNGAALTSVMISPRLAYVAEGIGVALIAIGIAYLVMAYGLWKGKGWAWTLTIVLSFIGIGLGVGSLVTGNIASIIHLVINGVIIYYLYRRHVKVFFGKTASASASPAAGM
jgi:hypothetical protein